jgi:hypothetical protein
MADEAPSCKNTRISGLITAFELKISLFCDFFLTFYSISAILYNRNAKDGNNNL